MDSLTDTNTQSQKLVLLRAKSSDAVVMDGLLFRYHAVHMIADGEFTDAWAEGEDRTRQASRSGLHCAHASLPEASDL